MTCTSGYCIFGRDRNGGEEPVTYVTFFDHFSIAIQGVLFFGIRVMEPQKLHYEIRHFPGSLHVFWVFLVFIKKSELRIYRKIR